MKARLLVFDVVPGPPSSRSLPGPPDERVVAGRGRTGRRFRPCRSACRRSGCRSACPGRGIPRSSPPSGRSCRRQRPSRVTAPPICALTPGVKRKKFALSLPAPPSKRSPSQGSPPTITSAPWPPIRVLLPLEKGTGRSVRAPIRASSPALRRGGRDRSRRLPRSRRFRRPPFRSSAPGPPAIRASSEAGTLPSMSTGRSRAPSRRAGSGRRRAGGAGPVRVAAGHVRGGYRAEAVADEEPAAGEGNAEPSAASTPRTTRVLAPSRLRL